MNILYAEEPTHFFFLHFSALAMSLNYFKKESSDQHFNIFFFSRLSILIAAAAATTHTTNKQTKPTLSFTWLRFQGFGRLKVSGGHLPDPSWPTWTYCSHDAFPWLPCPFLRRSIQKATQHVMPWIVTGVCAHACTLVFLRVPCPVHGMQSHL